MVTQVSDADLWSVHPPEMQHTPLAFVTGLFTKSDSRWATLDKEAFAIVETFRRLEWLPSLGSVVCTDHRIQPANSRVSTEQPANVCLTHTLENFKYSTRHISGTENLWGDLLSR